MTRRRALSLIAMGAVATAGLTVAIGRATATPATPPPPTTLDEVLAEADRVDGLLRLVAIRDGRVVVDGSFDGTGPDELLHLRSATKSVVSILVGIAINRGDIESVDQTLGELLGPRVTRFGPEKAELTLRHLLTMSTGLDWNEGNDVDEFNRLVTSDDPLRHYLSRPLVDSPGTTWSYSSGASHTLAAAVEAATGERLSTYAERHLFRPLDIETVRWPALRDGTTNGGAGLQMRARDAAKIGQLMLARGRWQGEQIVSAEWVEASTTPRLEVGDGTWYGWHWWLEGPEPTTLWLAVGFAGQLIGIVPELDIVVVTNSRWRRIGRSSSEQATEVHRFVADRLAPFLAPSLGG